MEDDYIYKKLRQSMDNERNIPYDNNAWNRLAAQLLLVKPVGVWGTVAGYAASGLLVGLVGWNLWLHHQINTLKTDFALQKVAANAPVLPEKRLGNVVVNDTVYRVFYKNTPIETAKKVESAQKTAGLPQNASVNELPTQQKTNTLVGLVQEMRGNKPQIEKPTEELKLNETATTIAQSAEPKLVVEPMAKTANEPENDVVTEAAIATKTAIATKNDVVTETNITPKTEVTTNTTNEPKAEVITSVITEKNDQINGELEQKSSQRTEIEKEILALQNLSTKADSNAAAMVETPTQTQETSQVAAPKTTQKLALVENVRKLAEVIAQKAKNLSSKADAPATLTENTAETPPITAPIKPITDLNMGKRWSVDVENLRTAYQNNHENDDNRRNFRGSENYWGINVGYKISPKLLIRAGYSGGTANYTLTRRELPQNYPSPTPRNPTDNPRRITARTTTNSLPINLWFYPVTYRKIKPFLGIGVAPEINMRSDLEFEFTNQSGDERYILGRRHSENREFKLNTLLSAGVEVGLYKSLSVFGAAKYQKELWQPTGYFRQKSDGVFMNLGIKVGF